MMLLIKGLAFLVAIGVLIPVHEFGHFWVARRLGFKVLRFSVGFGRPLLSRRGRDGVEYVLAAIPLGGYVRMLDEREGEVAPEDRPRAFNRQPIWRRVAVSVAGPGANFAFAVLAFWILFMHGVPGLKPVVGEVKPGSVAASAGLKASDEITSISGHPVATREAALLGILDAVVDGERVDLTVRRDGAERALTLSVPTARRRALTEPGAWSEGLGFGFSAPHLEAVVGTGVAGGPAALAGIRPGDQVLSVNGRAVADFQAFQTEISGRPGETVGLTLRRAGSLKSVKVDVAAERDTSAPGQPLVGRIRIAAARLAVFPPELQTVVRYGPLPAIAAAVKETWSKSALTVKFLWRMVTGDVSLKNVSGPISIASYAGLSAIEGWAEYLGFLALISISLAVLNLLPIPILDGGQVLYQLAEGLKGRPLSERTQALGQQFGIVLLILLMSLAFYNDLARHLG